MSFTRRSALVMALGAFGAAACSLVNSFDDLKDALDTNSSEAGSDAPVDVASDVVDAGAATGVIVVGGIAEADGGQVPVLTALDPTTGAELPRAREQLLVASVQYDGLRDLWYVFESNGASYFPTPTDSVFLRVRQLDTHTGAWTEVQSIKVPTLVAFTHVVVLRDRLAYVAYHAGAATDASSGKDLVVLDTSNPAQPSVQSSVELERDPIGLIGTRSSTAAGGSVTLIESSASGSGGGSPCDGGSACLQTRRATVGKEGPPSVASAPTDLGQFTGSPAFGSFLGKGSPLDYIGWTPAPPNGALSAYQPNNGSPSGTPIAFSINDAFLKPIAFADCLGQALLVGTNTETAVNAIPVAAPGTADRGVMQHSGQGVYYEPFTSTVLAPFTQGEGFELTAFKLEGTQAAPKLTLLQAPQWTPPNDLRPELIATRRPLPLVCP